MNKRTTHNESNKKRRKKYYTQAQHTKHTERAKIIIVEKAEPKSMREEKSQKI